MTSAVPPTWRGGLVAFGLSVVARAVLQLLAGLVLITVLPACFGWQVTVVSSGSMAPALAVGDVVASRPIGTVAPRLGQVLLVDDPDKPGTLRLHRYVGTADRDELVLRGDANLQADTTPVQRSALLGVASLRVPFVGLPAVWLRTGQVGRALLTAMAVAGLIAAALLFSPDGRGAAAADGRHPRTDPPTRRRLAGRHRLVPGLAATAAVGLTIGGAIPADAAALFAGTSNPANSFTTSSTFSCADRVIGNKAAAFLKLNETSGTTAADSSGNGNTGTYTTGTTLGVVGPCANGDSAVALDGGATTGVTTAIGATPPSTLSVEIWFRTTSTAGGLMLGSYTDPTSANANQDRVLYVTTTGNVAFGMYGGSGINAVGVTSTRSYNDGVWHLAQATYSAATGMNLYVDGASAAATNTTAFTPNTLSAYWRVGYGGIAYWAGAPTTNRGFAGSVSGAAVYTTVLTAADVANHFGVRSQSCAAVVTADAPSNFYPLADANGPAAADTSGNGHPGTYSGGVTYRGTGPCAANGSSVTLDGAAGTYVAVTSSVVRPQVFTAEIWFKTTTTSGGPILGLYENANSTGYIREPVVYMEAGGRIDFGMWDGFHGPYSVRSGSAYNDGAWHLIDASSDSTTGMTLSIDGAVVGTTSGAANDSYTGYWRFGAGDLSGWANQPPSSAFAGSLAGAAIYPAVLSATRTAAHFAAR